jgi:hypothetical protein
MTELAICVPVRDMLHSKFAFCLAELVARLVKDNVSYQLFFQNGSVLPEQRHLLAKSALTANCEQILWLDSDMVFPSNIYQLLSKHNKPVVACYYSTRSEPFRSVAFLDNRDMTKTLTATSGLHSVNSVGMGIMLTSTEVFKNIVAPWFSFRYMSSYDAYLGEDIVFCELLKEYDYDVFVDADASNYCAHLANLEIKIGDIYNV